MIPVAPLLAVLMVCNTLTVCNFYRYQVAARFPLAVSPGAPLFTTLLIRKAIHFVFLCLFVCLFPVSSFEVQIVDT
jgi:hypothetical protein